MDRTTHGELNDPFVFEDGRVLRSADEWRSRRTEIERLLVDIEYGGLPPEPAPVRAEQLHSHLSRILLDSSYTQYRVVLESDPRFHFRLDITLPPGEESVPCVLTGDGCWAFVTHDISRELIRRNIALAVFSRTEVVPDNYTNDRDTALYNAFPGETFGALSAWAWAYHRCVDVLEDIERVDSTKIGVVGHSRGGKTALLAGATDERIAVVAPNGSGSGGAGCYRWQGPDSETLEDTHRALSYWFGPELWQYNGKVEEMPFDQHFLKMLVAPRPLVSTEGLSDLWSNPEGTYQSYAAAREVYKFLGADENIGIWYRAGDHDHGEADWHAFIEFFEWRLNGKEPDQRFDANPYPDMKRAFSWSSPGRG